MPQPLSHDDFSVGADYGPTFVTFAGSFTSSTEAQGTVEISKKGGMCGDVLTLGWSATRQ